jgi:hypothetical protein
MPNGGKLEISTLKNGENYGYEILKNSKLFIRQSISPNYEGKKFESEQTATQMAKLIIAKLDLQCSPLIKIEEEDELTLGEVSDERIKELALASKEG